MASNLRYNPEKYSFSFLTKIHRQYSFKWLICISEEELIKLVKKFHGKNIYIPLNHEYYQHMLKPGKRPKIDECCIVLLRFIGAEKFYHLMDVYGGSVLRVPTREEFVKFYRERAIYEAWKGKTKRSTLAMQFQISISDVSNIITRQKKLSLLNKEYTKKYLALNRAIVNGGNHPHANYLRFIKSKMGTLLIKREKRKKQKRGLI